MGQKIDAINFYKVQIKAFEDVLIRNLKSFIKEYIKFNNIPGNYCSIKICYYNDIKFNPNMCEIYLYQVSYDGDNNEFIFDLTSIGDRWGDIDFNEIGTVEVFNSELFENPEKYIELLENGEITNEHIKFYKNEPEDFE